jgi:predicted CXXCH cytochrome family protein
MGRFKMPPQILRLVLLTLGIVGSYVGARTLLTPASFGQYGWFRGAALEEISARTPVYAGRKACAECHEDIGHKLALAEHKTISCESCHGVGRAHADNPDVQITKPGDALCLRCHGFNPSRPKWLKQITVEDHYRGEKCAGCHVPHQPNQVP